MSNLKCFSGKTRTHLHSSKDGHFLGKFTSMATNVCFLHPIPIHFYQTLLMQIQLQLQQWQPSYYYYCPYGDHTSMGGTNAFLKFLRQIKLDGFEAWPSVIAGTYIVNSSNRRYCLACDNSVGCFRLDEWAYQWANYTWNSKIKKILPWFWVGPWFTNVTKKCCFANLSLLLL